MDKGSGGQGGNTSRCIRGPGATRPGSRTLTCRLGTGARCPYLRPFFAVRRPVSSGISKRVSRYISHEACRAVLCRRRWGSGRWCGSTPRGLVEADLALGLGGDAVEDHGVEVGVEVGAEAVEEGDRPNLRVRTGAGAAVARRVWTARSRTRSPTPARAGSWWQKGWIWLGTESTHWRMGSGGST